MIYALLALAVAAIVALFLFLKNRPPAELPPSSTKSHPPPPPKRGPVSPRRAPEPGPTAQATPIPATGAKPATGTPASPGVAPAVPTITSRPPPPSTRAVGRSARDID